MYWAWNKVDAAAHDSDVDDDGDDENNVDEDNEDDGNCDEKDSDGYDGIDERKENFFCG